MRILQKDVIDLAIKAMKSSLEAEERYKELSEISEGMIDANCNMLSRIISFSERNGVPFDNGLRVLLNEARKALKTPTRASSEFEQWFKNIRRFNKTWSNHSTKSE